MLTRNINGMLVELTYSATV